MAAMLQGSAAVVGPPGEGAPSTPQQASIGPRAASFDISSLLHTSTSAQETETSPALSPQVSGQGDLPGEVGPATRTDNTPIASARSGPGEFDDLDVAVVIYQPPSGAVGIQDVVEASTTRLVPSSYGEALDPAPQRSAQLLGHAQDAHPVDAALRYFLAQIEEIAEQLTDPQTQADLLTCLAAGAALAMGLEMARRRLRQPADSLSARLADRRLRWLTNLG
jgi:hypothetical protein